MELLTGISVPLSTGFPVMFYRIGENRFRLMIAGTGANYRFSTDLPVPVEKGLATSEAGLHANNI